MRATIPVTVLLLLCVPAVHGHHQPLVEDDADRPALEGVQLSGRDSDGDYGLIHLLIEHGRRAPAQNLLRLDSVKKISLRIEGAAQFYYREKDGEDSRYVREVTYSAEMVRLPAVTPGGDEDSRLFVEVEGTEPWDPIRIAALDKGVIHDYWLTFESAVPLILRLDERRGYVLADTARVEMDKVRIDSEKLPEQPPGAAANPFSREPLHACEPLPEGPLRDGPQPEPLHGFCDLWCSPLVWYSPEPGDPFPNPGCGYNILPTGILDFESLIPGYSFKPETGESLVPVTQTYTLWVDGLYKSGWGCNVALKIPDFSVVLVRQSTASCCLGPLPILLGKKCEWIDPGPLPDWPDCPL